MVFDIPDIERAQARVLQKVHMHTDAVAKIMAAVQAKALRRKNDEQILEWLWPKTREEAVLRPKNHEDVGESCQWFLSSYEYKNWTGPGPSVLICTGKRTSPSESPDR